MFFLSRLLWSVEYNTLYQRAVDVYYMSTCTFVNAIANNGLIVTYIVYVFCWWDAIKGMVITSFDMRLKIENSLANSMCCVKPQ